VAASGRAAEIPVGILCGGRGTRLQERTRAIPKALVEIGGRPILWHVIQIYATQGFRRFVLLTGYLGEMIEEFVGAHDWPEPIEVECVDTGADTPTGGRVALARERFAGGTSCLTYADGVADVDLAALLSFHAAQGVAATMTVVRPHSQWGVALLDGDGRVEGFREKPRVDQWVNGGFFCIEPEFLAHVTPDSVLEREPLEGLASAGRLAAFQHEGFWDCMDTYKDAIVLNDLWASGDPPWRVWAPQTDRPRV
jgi:glucose-1-phosphate cytidylyltransferase